MLSNLNGWHAVILLVLLLAMAAVVALVVLLVAGASVRARVGTSGKTPERLRRLEELRHDGSITEAEYDSKRAKLLDGL